MASNGGGFEGVSGGALRGDGGEILSASSSSGSDGKLYGGEAGP